MKIPKAVQNLVDVFERLPGIGPKTAQRLTFYLLHVPQAQLDKFALSLSVLKKDTAICSLCYSIDDKNPCGICTSTQRDNSIICVVEQPLDVLAFERSGRYKGIYHVLHGRIDPLNNIGPEEIYIPQLFSRVRQDSLKIREVILATDPTMEGEATAMYIQKQFKDNNFNIKVSRIGRGLPVGADIEYADEITLDNAIEGRREYV